MQYHFATGSIIVITYRFYFSFIASNTGIVAYLPQGIRLFIKLIRIDNMWPIPLQSPTEMQYFMAYMQLLSSFSKSKTELGTRLSSLRRERT